MKYIFAVIICIIVFIVDILLLYPLLTIWEFKFTIPLSFRTEREDFTDNVYSTVWGNVIDF